MNRIFALLIGSVLAGSVLTSCASGPSGGVDGSGYAAPQKMSTSDYTDRLLNTHKDLRY